MKMHRIATFLFLMVLASTTFAAGEPTDPEGFIRDTAEEVLNRIDGKREAIRNDATVAEGIIEESLLPHVDVDYISRLVLARNWRSATEDQQKRFQDAFYSFLVRSYASGLAEFTEDRFKVLPLRGEVDQRRTIVQTEVYRDNGQAVPVAFTLRWTEDGWKMYDVIIEGISYVNNYRTDFNTEIQQKGLDSLIQRLESGSMNEDVGAAEATAGS